MSNQENLNSLADEFEVLMKADQLRSWLITDSVFPVNEPMYSELSDDRATTTPWNQLAGLIRFFAIAIEGAIEYAPAFAQPEVTFMVQETQERLRITCGNRCKPLPERRRTDARYAGMHGWEIRRFIYERFLGTLQPNVPEPIDSDTSFSIELQIDKPKWLYKVKRND